jgi:hypothetical protein
MFILPDINDWLSAVERLAVQIYFPILQKQVCEIRTPLLVWLVRMEILLKPVLKYFVQLLGLCTRFLGRTMECRPISVFIYLRMVVAL